jgi:hypothetical protein
LPLKYIYSNGILALVYNYIIYIAKEDFLLAFKVVYNKAFIKNNIYIGFRGTKLVLLNLDIIILKFNIQLYILIFFI